MNRRSGVAPFLLPFAASVLVAACGFGEGPSLTDPSEILVGAAATLRTATSVHLDATVDGSVSVDLTRTGTSASLNLAGTSLSGDVDLASRNAHISAAIPAFLGLTADVIVIGPDTWTKASLSGEKFQHGETGTSDLPDPSVLIDGLAAFLARPDIDPVKKDDAPCGATRCYVVEIAVAASELTSLVPAAFAGIVSNAALADARLVATVLVEKGSLRPASVSFRLNGDSLGDVRLDVGLRDWDRPVSISPPPADQVE